MFQAPTGATTITMTETASETSSLPIRASISASSSTSLLPSPTPTPKPLRAPVANPYKRGLSTSAKTSCKVSNNSEKDSRRRFIERCRGHVLQIQRNFDEYNTRCGIPDPHPLSVTSVSAMYILRTYRNWQRDDSELSGGKGEHVREKCDGDCSSIGSGFLRPRPRFFLFKRFSYREDFYDDTVHSSRLQSWSSGKDGLWELGTGITELSGEGGSGKTQTCLSLCVDCASTPLPNLPLSVIRSDLGSQCNKRSEGSICNLHPPSHYTAIYVSMGEGIPSPKIANRLNQMMQSRQGKIQDCSSHASLSRANHCETNVDSMNRGNDESLSRINLVNLHNEEDFLCFLEEKLPSVLKGQYFCQSQHYQNQHQNQSDQIQRPIRQQHIPAYQIGILVFDGIAGLFRFSDLLCHEGNYSTSSDHQKSNFHIERSKLFYRISRQLRKLSDEYEIPVVVTNQVTATFSMLPTHGSGDVVPALGMAWSYCVNTRFILRRKDGLVLSITSREGSDSEKTAKSKGINAKKRRVEKQIRHGVRHARVLQSVNVLKPDDTYFVIDTASVVSMT